MSRMGKYVTVSWDDDEGVKVCDYTGFVFNESDTVKQRDWRGNLLVYTGMIVGERFADKPQEQNRVPLPKNDPYPIKDPRLPANYVDPNNNPVPSPPQLLAKLRNFNWNG